MMWSIGGSLTTECRKPFDVFVKRLCGGDIQVPAEIKKKKLSLPERGSMYDYSLEMKANRTDVEWINWIEHIKNETISPKALVHEILVKTADTVRYSYLLLLNIKNQLPTLFCGPTGTGKSVYIKNVLMNQLERDQYTTIEVGFSAQTSSTQTQDIIDSKLDRRKKGYYGPKFGKSVLFVDDLNMPAKQKWGAQPPIEILR